MADDANPDLDNRAHAENLPAAMLTLNQLVFLAAFSQVGNVSRASRASGTARALHYQWLKGDPGYQVAFKVAEEEFIDSVRDAVRERAIHGWDEPVVYQGRIATVTEGEGPTAVVRQVVVRKFSDRLLELLAKAKVPEFREALDVNHNFNYGDALDLAEQRYQDHLRKKATQPLLPS